uniref:RAB6-interacting golgin n=1 Tax=Cannabis sativa TaxID=3483 RepID=A0A803NWU2_CANSA
MQKMNNFGGSSSSSSAGNMSSNGRQSVEEIKDDDQEISRLAISTFQAREEEIERRKMEVKEKVELQLGRAEEETKRLARIWEQLEEMTDPLRKEVANVRKKIDMANRELKPLGLSCQKKKEYKEVLDMFNEKSKEKAQLVSTLKELLAESERLRMVQLEELSKHVASLK